MKTKTIITRITAVFACAVALEAAAQNAKMRFTLNDGSVFYGVIVTNSIPVQTEFGRVNVPVRTLRSIDTGASAQQPRERGRLARTNDDAGGAEDPLLSPAPPANRVGLVFSENFETPNAKNYAGETIPGRNGMGRAFRVRELDVEIAKIPADALKHGEGTLEFWARIPDAKELGWAPNYRTPALIQVNGPPIGVWIRYEEMQDGEWNLGGFSGSLGSYMIMCDPLKTGFTGNNSLFQDADPAGWHHYAITWNKNGLDLPGEAYALNISTRQKTGIPKPYRDNPSCAVFLNGRLVAAGMSQDMLHTASDEKFLTLCLQQRRDVTAFPQPRIIDYDDIKLWNKSKLDFNDAVKAQPWKREQPARPSENVNITPSPLAVTPLAQSALSNKKTHVDDPGLMYWNTFENEDDIRNPKVGPKSELKRGAQFVPGVSGNALYTSGLTDVVQFVFPDTKPMHKGCVEFWARLVPRSDSFGSGTHPRFFWWSRVGGIGGIRLDFSSVGGGLLGTVAGGCCAFSGVGGSTYSSILGSPNNTWHHYALVWNDEGLSAPGCEGQLLAVLLDGKAVTRTTFLDSWNAGYRILPSRLGTIDGATTFQIAPSLFTQDNTIPFAIDELKVWNYDRTEF